MPKRGPDRTYVALPRGRIRPLRVLWLFWAGSVLAVLGGAMVFWLADSVLPSRNAYVGDLRPNADPIALDLPEGAVLGEILVDRNEEVRQGQTLVTLDIPAMERYVRELEAELTHDKMLRDCLLGAASLIPDLGAASAHIDPVLAAAITLAEQACATQREETDLVEENRDQQRAVLAEKHQLLEQYIAALTEIPQPGRAGETRRAIALRALALSLARNRIEEDLVGVEDRARKALLVAQRGHVSRAEDLSKDIRFKSDLRARLLSYLDQPRLVTPEAGQVVRVRRLASGSKLDQSVTVVELRPNDRTGYRASFRLEPEHRQRVTKGQIVEIEMLSVPKNTPPLRGTVTSLISTEDGRLQADITLDAQSTLRLDDPQNGIALRGVGTASVIHVRYGDYGAFDMASRHLHDTFLPGPTRWWDRLVPGEEPAVPEDELSF